VASSAKLILTVKNFPSNWKNMQPKELLCGACNELLFEPLAMPCGYNICGRCHRRGKTYYYTCPVIKCKNLHYFREKRLNTTINDILYKLFEPEQRCYTLLFQGENKLSQYFTDNCKNNCGEDCTLPNENIELLNSILIDYINPSIEQCPYLQLPYLVRSKALAELGHFDLAILDAQKAHKLNIYNNRGLVAEKLAVWRSEMMQSNLHVLAKCALSAIDESGGTNRSLQESGGSVPVIQAASDLLRQCDDIEKTKLMDDLIKKRNEFHDYNDIPLSFAKILETKIGSNMNGIEHCLECPICMNLFYEPVTSPCGHSFCRQCLIRTLDNADSCPICRAVLPGLNYFTCISVDQNISSLLSSLQIKSVTSLQRQSSPKHIPVFICSLVFPFTNNTFHIFEPKYRALVKSCLDGNKEFGIVMPDGNNSCREYGSLVKIIAWQPLESHDLVQTTKGLLPRFMIQTRALHRIKIISLRQNEAGYQEAIVERLDDFEPENLKDFNPEYLDSLIKKCDLFVNTLLSSAPPNAKLAFNRKHGISPEDPMKYSFWLAGILPLNPLTLYNLLPIVDVTSRMEFICKWIDAAHVDSTEALT
jgi:Lon protease-like protein